MMKKRVSDQFWFPFWVDKWIFGSMRIECTLEERAIWIDLLAFASKDEGYIRANEETPYLIQQLVGMLLIPEDKLKLAIKKFIKLRKLEEPIPGIYRITTWEKYQLSESYKRVQKHREKKKKKKALRCNGNGVTILNKNRLKHNKLNNNTKEILTLLSKAKNYPFNIEKDTKFIEELKTEFPDVDVLEKVKQVTINWLKFPLLKKSRPRVQIRRWVFNEQKWQKEGERERQVGTSRKDHKTKFHGDFLHKVYDLLRKQKKDGNKYADLIFALTDQEAKQAAIKYNDNPAEFIKFLEEKKQ